MIFKSPSQPLCRYCGSPIAKHTRVVWIEKQAREHHGTSEFGRYIVTDEPPKTRAECERLTNMKVTSIARWGEFGHVRSFNEWDGESYRDEFFCKGACARRFGYLAARKGVVRSQAWVDAERKARGLSVL